MCLQFFKDFFLATQNSQLVFFFFFGQKFWTFWLKFFLFPKVCPLFSNVLGKNPIFPYFLVKISYFLGKSPTFSLFFFKNSYLFLLILSFPTGGHPAWTKVALFLWGKLFWPTSDTVHLNGGRHEIMLPSILVSEAAIQFVLHPNWRLISKFCITFEHSSEHWSALNHQHFNSWRAKNEVPFRKGKPNVFSHSLTSAQRIS